MILNTASGGPRHPFNAGRQYPGMMGEDFSESVGDHFSESGDDNISEWMGGFPRNQHPATANPQNRAGPRTRQGWAKPTA